MSDNIAKIMIDTHAVMTDNECMSNGVTFYRGTKDNGRHALDTNYFAIYGSTDINVARRYAGDDGIVWAITLPEGFELTTLADAVDAIGRVATPDLDTESLFGFDADGNRLAEELGIRGVIDERGNVEIIDTDDADEWIVEAV